MIDSVSSLISAISMLGSAARAGSISGSSPVFLRLLKGLAVPLAGENSASTARDGEPAGAGETAASSTNTLPIEDLLSALAGQGSTAGEPAVSSDAKKDQDSTTAILEMMLALMGVGASPLQPWQISGPESAVRAPGGTGAGPDPQAVEVSKISAESPVAASGQAPLPAAPVTVRQAMLGVDGNQGPANRQPGEDQLDRILLLMNQTSPATGASPAGPSGVGTPPTSSATPGPIDVAQSLLSQTTSRGTGAPPLVADAPQQSPVHGDTAPATYVSDRRSAISIDRQQPTSANITLQVDSPAQANADVRGGTDAKNVGLIGPESSPRPGQPAGSEIQPAIDRFDSRGQVLAQGLNTSDGSESSSYEGAKPHQQATVGGGLLERMSSGEPFEVAALQASATQTEAGRPGILRASVVEQITRHIRLATLRGRSGLSIQLEPRDLGRVQVHVSSGTDGLRIGLAAESSDTRDLIQASLPQLRAAFESQGLMIDRFELDTGAGFTGFGSADGGAQQRSGLSNAGADGRYLSSEETSPDASEASEIGSRDSLVDYRI